MARYKPDLRQTYQLLPGSLDALLPEDSIARDSAAGLDQLDFSSFDQLYSNDEAGCTAIDPRALTGIIIFGLLRGVTSSVKLAALCVTQVEFRWLARGVPVEKSTLCAFRKNHVDQLLAMSTQILEALGRHGLLPGENMGVDGSIVRAASSRCASKKRKRLEKAHGHLEQVLREKLEGEDQENQAEEPAEAEHVKNRRERVTRALEEMTRRGLNGPEDKLTVTEPDAGVKRQKDGSFAPGYNAQVVSDLDSGVIVHAEIVDAANDSGQLGPQIAKARAALEESNAGPPANGTLSVTADAAYHDTRQLHELEGNGTACYVPEARNTNRKAPGIADEYQAEAFGYDEVTDTVRCPEGQKLAPRKANRTNTATVYEAPAKVCAACPAKPKCCPNTKGGRSVNRTMEHYQATLDHVAAGLETEEGERRWTQRRITCEGVFARLTELLHWRRNRMWETLGARAELAWRVLTHNLLILLGVWKPMTLGDPPGMCGNQV